MYLSFCPLSNRVEAWTRDVDFLLRQEGRPTVNLIPKKTKIRVMERDWENTDRAVNWLRNEAINYTQPFVLYLGLNLPHPYPSPSSGENFGSSTFRTSLYWLKKVSIPCVLRSRHLHYNLLLLFAQCFLYYHF